MIPVRRRTARGREQGATIVVVALAAVGLFGFAALAVDLGNAWATRRHLVTATDAAALGAARDYALGDNGCAGTDDDLVAANYSAASVTGCTSDGGSDSGWVRVAATSAAEFIFAGVLGFDASDIDATTTARWGTPSGVRGLRPIALCVEVDEVADWLGSGRPSPSAAYTITYNKDSPNLCGEDAPGNWGLADFDGGANSANDTKDWIESGYPGEVSVGELVEGDTGAYSNSFGKVLAALVGERFVLPLYRSVSGNGANALFEIDAFVGVELVDFKVTGAEAKRSLTIRFVDYVSEGTCCTTPSVDYGLRTVLVCTVVDHDPDDCT